MINGQLFLVILLVFVHWVTCFSGSQYHHDIPTTQLGHEASSKSKLNITFRTVTTSQGKIRGMVLHDYDASLRLDRGIQRFIGIRYAEPPTGARRFKAPVKAKAWAPKTYDALKYGSICLQIIKLPFIPGSESEDCLFLNVFLPAEAGTSDHLYPVMLYFHGGAFATGSSIEYDPTRWITKVNNVIVVTINYRLGGFGFLMLESMNDADFNAAFLDQRMALQWVQDNIEAFGGDPKRVTIFGESAGATSVISHLAAEKSWPLFSRAIVESGGWIEEQQSTAFATYEALATSLGCGINNITAPNTQLECMQQIPAETFLSNNFFGMPTAGDRCETKDQPLRMAYSHGNIAPVPLLVGNSLNEGLFFMKTTFFNAPNPMSDQYFENLVNSTFSDKDYGSYLVKFILELYAPLRKQVGNYDTFTRIYGDYLIACNSQVALNVSLHAPFEHNTYSYVFSQHSKFAVFSNATHFSEVPFLLGIPLPMNDNDKIVERFMMTWWSNFASSGNPNINDDDKVVAATKQQPHLPLWPSYDPELLERPTVMNIKYPYGEASPMWLAPFEHDTCSAWSSYFLLVPPFPKSHNNT